MNTDLLFNWKVIGYIVLMNAAIGCGHDSIDQAGSFANLDFAQAEYFDLEDVDDVEILPIFSDANVFVDQMRYGQVTEEYYFFITAQYKIHVFDPEFHLVGTILDMGKGPGEVIMPTGLSKSEEDSEFYIVDPGNRKILRMDVAGNVIEEILTAHWIKNANKFSEEENLYIGNVNTSKSPAIGKSYDLVLLDDQGEVVQGYFEFEDDGAFGMGNGRNLHRITADHFGYYRMYEDRIFHVYADGPREVYQFNLEMPLLPSSLVVEHVRGNVGLDEYVYFLSYFENTDHLLLTHELDRNKYWSVYDKINDRTYNYKFSHEDECENCTFIFTIAMSDKGAIAIVNGETLLRIIDQNTIAETIPAGTDVESESYLIRIPFLK